MQLHLLIFTLAACQTASGSDRAEARSSEPERASISEIEAGIERYIDEQSDRNNGHFTVHYEGEELNLKLVRVHTEYLANLGPERHFACVDLADTKGDVYDVDFFLEGEPGDMRVTETSVHKLNGKPFYVWEQHEDGTWARADVDGAPPELLGVVEGRDRFEFEYELTIPELTGEARIWIPLPTSDRFQSVDGHVHAPVEHRVLTDTRYGNKVLFMELGPEQSGETIVIHSTVERAEKSAYQTDETDPEAYLTPVIDTAGDTDFSAIADEITAGKTSELVKSRAIYDHTIEYMRYAKFGDYGSGDALHARRQAHGNCTEYHAYFISLSRAAGIPARFAIGAAVPAARDEGGVDGYHCWAEFYAEGKWWPVDISEADKYSALSTYYFGHNPANRIELSRGRGLGVEPGPSSGPIDFLAYPVLEVEGEPVPVKPTFSFERIE